MNAVYISGPMTGYPEFNYPAFNRAESRILISGRYDIVYNPANYPWDGPLEQFPIRDAFITYVNFLTRTATAIYMLRGWEKSTGARAEHALAVALSLKIEYEE